MKIYGGYVCIYMYVYIFICDADGGCPWYGLRDEGVTSKYMHIYVYLYIHM